MRQENPFETNVREYEDWFDKFSDVFNSEILALKEHLETLPSDQRGIQVGIGTGRYATQLGIKEGVEPSANMRELAGRRGIKVTEGTAESLPYGDESVDFILFATVEHLSDITKAAREAYRVLKPGGTLIMGFLEKNKPVAKSYLISKNESLFYRNAKFYTREGLETLLQQTGFKSFVVNQTLFGKLEEIEELQFPKAGSGEGSYVSLRAIRK